MDYKFIHSFSRCIMAADYMTNFFRNAEIKHILERKVPTSSASILFFPIDKFDGPDNQLSVINSNDKVRHLVKEAKNPFKYI